MKVVPGNCVALSAHASGAAFTPQQGPPLKEPAIDPKVYTVYAWHNESIRLGVHAQAGILSPLGVGGAYLSLSPSRRLTIMAGGGLSLLNPSSDYGWRAGIGVAGHLMVSGRHALSVEVWGSLGSWSAIAIDFDGISGDWSVMPAAHVHLSYETRLTDHIELRMFMGVMTNFGFDPDNVDACQDHCDGPFIAPSTGMSVGYLF